MQQTPNATSAWLTSPMTSQAMTMEEFQQRRLEERRAKNREAAAESRRRVKDKIHALQSRLQRTEEENAQLRVLVTWLLQQQVHPQAGSSPPPVAAMNSLQSDGFAVGCTDQYNNYMPPPTDGPLMVPVHGRREEPNALALPPLGFPELLEEDLRVLEDALML